MGSKSEVYIVGVGFSTSKGSSQKAIITSLVSASTKALLDAGVTYDDVAQIVTMPSYGTKVSRAFGDRDITINEVERESQFDVSFKSIRERAVQGVMLTLTEEVCVRVFYIFDGDRFHLNS